MEAILAGDVSPAWQAVQSSHMHKYSVQLLAGLQSGVSLRNCVFSLHLNTGSKGRARRDQVSIYDRLLEILFCEKHCREIITVRMNLTLYRTGYS